MFTCHRTQTVCKLAHLRLHNIGSGRSQHQRVGEIVDILRRAAEMQEVLQRLGFGAVAESLTDEILHRFDVVIRGRLDRLDSLGIIHRKIVNDAIQDILHHRCNWRYLRDLGLVGQALQPAHLDQDPKPHQPVFAEDIAKIVGLFEISPVGRGQGAQLGDFHG